MQALSRCAVASVAVGAIAGSSQAGVVQLQVTVQNLAPANSVSFAPLRIGFNNGTFDAFDEGATATAPIISIAEGGSGSDWFPAFAAADPTATLGTVVPNPAGPLLPDGSASAVFSVDPTVNPFFTFAAMVVPSNDYFIGNDLPTRYSLFDAGGNLTITNIMQRAGDIWDAGSEVDDPANAAFIMGGVNGNRIPDNDVVAFDFGGLSIFNGLTTAAGYVFDLQLQSDTPVYSISFAVVPEPASAALIAICGVLLRRR